MLSANQRLERRMKPGEKKKEVKETLTSLNLSTHPCGGLPKMKYFFFLEAFFDAFLVAFLAAFFVAFFLAAIRSPPSVF